MQPKKNGTSDDWLRSSSLKRRVQRGHAQGVNDSKDYVDSVEVVRRSRRRGVATHEQTVSLDCAKYSERSRSTFLPTPLFNPQNIHCRHLSTVQYQIYYLDLNQIMCQYRSLL